MRKLAILIVLAILPAVCQAKLYKWVDAQGNVHYSDTMPDSQSASKGTSVLNQRAIVVKQAETPEQREAKLLADKKNRENELIRLEQARRDKALVETFANPKEIDRLRDRNLEQVDAGINTNAARQQAANKRLTGLLQQQKRFTSANKAIPKDLLADIVNTQNELKQIDKETAARRQERSQLILRAEEDKKRLQELRGN